MAARNKNPRATFHSALAKNRSYQLAGAFFFAVLLPWIVRSAFGIASYEAELIRNTVVANGLAVLLGYYMYQSVTLYPGVQASYFILPTFSAAYALVILGLVFSRLEYNRVLLAAGFTSCVVWYYGVVLLAQRRRLLRIGVVPFGDLSALYEIERVNWQPLASSDPAQAIAYDSLVADFRADLPDEWERFLADATLSGVTVLHEKELRESLTGRVQIDHLSENNFGSLIPDHAYLKIKQVGDFVTALVALVLLLPLLVLVAVAIRLDSPGPALYSQKRVGYAGRVFNVYKFRTMRHASSDQFDRQTAITEDDDPRVTRLGRRLRRSRIDELPQLINILRGEMSWIGPRPEAQILSQWYEQELPFYRYRHIVRPGISGWAQVNQGHVAEVHDVFSKLQYDFYYIRHFSPWLDALIVARTILTMISGFGSR